MIPPKREEQYMKKDSIINIRLTPAEKEKICSKAKKCGFPPSTYVRQIISGYEPKEAPTLEYHQLITLLSELYTQPQSPETKAEIISTLKQIQSAF